MDNIGTYGGKAVGSFPLSGAVEIPYVFASALALQVVAGGFWGYEALLFLKVRKWACGADSTSDVDSAPNLATKIQDVVAEDANPIDEEVLERAVQHLLPHSFCRPVRNFLLDYLRDQNTVKPIRPCRPFELLTDFPSMLMGSLPLLIPLWIFTSYYWTSLFGLMIWDRIGSDVVHGLLSRTLKGLRWVWDFIGDSYQAIFRINGSATTMKASRLLRPWMYGPLGKLLHAHGGCA
ncbi:hypothetical protein NM208_g15358 [Fusarium decemcellulare]|uniref:Uncharacterized protein n=1 Tax=Fusarium decemcellulare TaxID=57161 RepID=A0ACC1RGR2_9HYPO|nr:hypothetical protein NM208_g15358 [Fusarium decemcellulare]